MTIEKLIELYPDRPFSILRVGRGATGDRKLVWMAQWYAGYFTSDTDRHVYHEASGFVFGDTMEEALEKLAFSELELKKREIESTEKFLEECRAEAEEMAQHLGVTP